MLDLWLIKTICFADFLDQINLHTGYFTLEKVT